MKQPPQFKKFKQPPKIKEANKYDFWKSCEDMGKILDEEMFKDAFYLV